MVTTSTITDRILSLSRSHPVRVGIDGFCAAGKTTLAARLADELQARERTVIRACGDDFQNPPEVRWQLGNRSPKGFFRHAMDFDALRSELLVPLGPGGSLKYRTSIYDVHASRPNVSPQSTAAGTEILLLDGLFLHAPALAGCLDLTVYVDADYETCIARAQTRQQERSRSPEEIEALYRERYVPGFQLYVAEVRPQQHASLIFLTSSDLLRVERGDGPKNRSNIARWQPCAYASRSQPESTSGPSSPPRARVA